MTNSSIDSIKQTNKISAAFNCCKTIQIRLRFTTISQIQTATSLMFKFTNTKFYWKFSVITNEEKKWIWWWLFVVAGRRIAEFNDIWAVSRNVVIGFCLIHARITWRFNISFFSCAAPLYISILDHIQVHLITKLREERHLSHTNFHRSDFVTLTAINI